MLKHPAINGWPLFWLITAPTTLLILLRLLRTAPLDGPAVSSLIQLSVRCAVPWLMVVFASSAVQVLRPGPVGMWLLRNRKFLGLAFAAAMGWQGVFILWLVLGYTDYYMQEIYVLRDAIEGVIGYAFIAAMTLTSFQPLRKWLTGRQWKLLHRSGVYFIWAYAFSTYWWNLFYYPNPTIVDHVYYWAGFAAITLRVAAWNRKRSKRAWRPGARARPALFLPGVGLVGFALLAAGLGSQWQPAAERLLYGHSMTLWAEQYLPFWPFEPFLPLWVLGCGAFLIATAQDDGGRVQIARSGDGTAGSSTGPG